MLISHYIAGSSYVILMTLLTVLFKQFCHSLLDMATLDQHTTISQLFFAQKWSTYNFSLQFQYIISQTGYEKTQPYQLADAMLF